MELLLSSKQHWSLSACHWCAYDRLRLQQGPLSPGSDWFQCTHEWTRIRRESKSWYEWLIVDECWYFIDIFHWLLIGMIWLLIIDYFSKLCQWHPLTLACRNTEWNVSRRWQLSTISRGRLCRRCCRTFKAQISSVKACWFLVWYRGISWQCMTIKDGMFNHVLTKTPR